eukprot:TRINITY_DN4333_c0_g2_i9.p1 TRINITY_DN4333_c0_g2~~TRINITY_DN4333_c0_g2_i9.p1  ORF type:complete len:186 (+),score=62.77 TRINITY_DN4333_c0_g2_i9:65-622(+)
MCIRDRRRVHGEKSTFNASLFKNQNSHRKPNHDSDIPMVHPIFRKLIQSAINVGFKSVINAYKQTVNKSGKKAPQNPFSEYLNKTMQNMNIAHKPMTPEEAVKILGLESGNLNATAIMEKYVKLFDVNDSSKGGSFYVQSKVFYAKEELMKSFPGEEKKAAEQKTEKKKQQSKIYQIANPETDFG